MSKKSFFEEEKKDSVETLFFCALVFRAPLKKFEDIKTYLTSFAGTELIFQKLSTDYLWIIKAAPKETKT